MGHEASLPAASLTTAMADIGHATPDVAPTFPNCACRRGAMSWPTGRVIAHRLALANGLNRMSGHTTDPRGLLFEPYASQEQYHERDPQRWNERRLQADGAG